MASWNPWHGCQKISAGCLHCYVYRIDEKHGIDSRTVHKTADFDLPIRMNRRGEYKLAAGETVYTCFSSDFFLDAADEWRQQAWRMIRQRSDLSFFIVTKRIHRFAQCLPPDWGGGYENVSICCTVENQDRADYRLPLFLRAPIRHKSILCEPLLERVDFSPYLGSWAEEVTVGGESGEGARLCDYAWVTDLRRQCLEKGIPFCFKQTGARFRKDGRVYSIPRKDQHPQAKKAGIDLPETRLTKER